MVNLGDQLLVLRKRWKVVVAVLALCVLASVTATLLQRKTYQATAEIFVSTADGDSTTALAQGNTFAQARVQSYIDAATSPDVTARVAEDFPDLTAGEIASKISADAPNGKVLINIHVSDTSPTRAANLANAVAEQFKDFVEGLELPSGSTTSPVKLTVIQPAVAPSVAASPQPLLNVGIGAVVGLLLGVGIAFARELLDNTIKSAEQLTAISDLPVMGAVPFDKQAGSQAIASRSSTHGRRAEAFRHVRVNLDFVDASTPTRVLAVTSAVPGEGKSSTAINIAAALAEGGERVCLVEADLRRPSIADKLGLVSQVGLTSVLIGKASVEEVLQNAGHNLAVMTAGALPPNPNELLHSQAFRDTLRYLSEKVDRVVVDTAPLLPVADGVEVASAADIALLVVRSGKTTHEQVRRAVKSLSQVDIVPVGAILSMTNERNAETYGYYYYGREGQPLSNNDPEAPGARDSRERQEAPDRESLDPSSLRA